MSYYDERQRAADGARTVMETGCGKTVSAGLVAYWHLLHTRTEGEEDPGSAADERFTPLPDEELEMRLSALDELTVEPLPDDIESLSDTSRFLTAESLEPGTFTAQTNPRTGEQSGRSQNIRGPLRRFVPDEAPRRPVWDAWEQYAASRLEEVRRYYSAVLLVCATEGRSGVPFRTHFDSPWTSRPKGRGRQPALPLGWDVGEEFTRADSPVFYDGGLSEGLRRHDAYYDRLRSAMQAYFTLRARITVVVDNMGAAQDPDAALHSLITDATAFRAAQGDDGTWTVVVMAPAVSGGCRHAVDRPRLAVMELPDDPPRLNTRQPHQYDDSEELLRRLTHALTNR